MKIIKQKITPFLWFDDQAEEAMNFYTSIFKNSEIKSLTRYAKGGPGPEGTIMTASFTLEGQEFVALNGGPHFQFTEAVSFVVNCESQEEVDMFWKKLSEGGSEGQCGWLKDKYGLSWQVIPVEFTELLQSVDSEKLGRVMQALMKMKKLDINVLKQA